ncbi:MAG TPA: hypothetical protein VFX05_06980 [Casimicrobiaceae bacterium]|nr:hypothetical protein [Casimicrobiaceae bacterium]
MNIAIRSLLGVLLGAAGLMAAESAFAAEDVPGCGNLVNAYGPYDYRTDKKHLAIVERHHFSSAVNHASSPRLVGDLDYTLRAFPNHHEALLAMMKVHLREKKTKLPQASFSIECYFLRAETWRPDDAVVKMIFGLFLVQAGQPQLGVQKLEAAKALGVADPNIPYNTGLAYFQMGEYDKALASAHEAYRMGHPLPGLRNLLEKAGRWKEANAAPTAPTSATAPAQ